MGRPPGSKNKIEKPVKKRKYTQEQLDKKMQQTKKYRETAKLIKNEVDKVLIDPSTTQVTAAAIVVPNVSTDEKVAYLESSFGCSRDIRNEMSSGSITSVYAAAKVFESMHIRAGRKRSSMLRKFTDDLKSQSHVMCSGFLVKELERQFCDRLRTTVWHPARISELQDSMLSSCMNMHTLDALNRLTRSTKTVGAKHYIPSRATVQRYNRHLENSMRVLVNSQINRTGTRVVLVLHDLITQIILHSAGGGQENRNR